MEPETKLYVLITNYRYDTLSPVEINDEQEAMQCCLDSHGAFFRTYEVTIVELGGKQLKGEPENYSERCFVNVDRLYTIDDVISGFNQDLAEFSGKTDFNSRIEIEALQSVIQHFEEKRAVSPDACYIDEPGGRPGD